MSHVPLGTNHRPPSLYIKGSTPSHLLTHEAFNKMLFCFQPSGPHILPGTAWRYSTTVLSDRLHCCIKYTCHSLEWRTIILLTRLHCCIKYICHSLEVAYDRTQLWFTDLNANSLELLATITFAACWAPGKNKTLLDGIYNMNTHTVKANKTNTKV